MPDVATTAPPVAENRAAPAAGPAPGTAAFKSLYVGSLLKLLPSLLNAGTVTSAAIRRESEFQEYGYTFALTVRGTDLAIVCRKGATGRWKALVPDPAMIEAASYCIDFRSLDYAFDCFTGTLSLKDALVARMFTTRGPNDTGVSLTYMFNAVLSGFFGFRSAYKPRAARTRR